MPTLTLNLNHQTATTSSLGSASHSLSPRVATPGGSLFLRSPTSPTGNKLAKITNVHDVTEKGPNVCPYAFRPPTENDSRGPCPALNTLANHGYLPRNGRDITRAQFLAALENPETYHLSRPLAALLVYVGFMLMRRTTGHSLSLHDLAQHGLIEHDASIVHRNTAPHHKYAPIRCDTILLDNLLDDDGSLNLEKVARRRVELEKKSPLDKLHQELARGEWALVLDIFGKDHEGNIPNDLLKLWLKQDQFIDGWKPSHKQGLVATAWRSFCIRKEMNKLKKEYKKSVTNDATHKTLVLILTLSCIIYLLNLFIKHVYYV